MKEKDRRREGFNSRRPYDVSFQYTWNRSERPEKKQEKLRKMREQREDGREREKDRARKALGKSDL